MLIFVSILSLNVFAANEITYPLYLRIDGNVVRAFGFTKNTLTWNELVELCNSDVADNGIVVGSNRINKVDNKIILQLDRLANGNYNIEYFIVDPNSKAHVDPSSVIVNQNDFKEALYDTVLYKGCTEHNYVVTSKVEPLCLVDGYEILKCVNCGFTERKTISELGHKINDPKIILEATCEENGVVGGICEYCRCEVTSDITPLGHDLNWLNKCQRCDYKKNIIGNWWNNKVVSGVQNLGLSIGNWWNDKFVPGEKNLVEYITLGEDGKGLFRNVFGNSDNDDKDDGFLDNILSYGKAILVLILSIPVIFAIYFFAFGSAKIIKLVEENLRKKKGNRK